MFYTCPCCGFKTFNSPPGSDEICNVCNWEDDVSQLRFVQTVGANKLSLIEAQSEFILKRSKIQTDAQLDPDWRPIDPKKDRIEESLEGFDYGSSYPSDTTDLYYWKK